MTAQDGVAFDSYELMALESVLTPTEVTPSGGGVGIADQRAASRDLCLKIGSALIQAREKGGETDLVLSEIECWILRERVNIFMSIGQRHDLGLSLKLKLYKLLLEYAFAKEVGNIETANHEERSAREVRYELDTEYPSSRADPNASKTNRRSGNKT